MTGSPRQIAETAQTAIVRGEFALAAEAFAALIALLPEAPASLHYNLGLALKHAGRNREALAALDGALRIDPAHGNARFERAAVLIALKQPQAALEEIDRYLMGAPADVDALRTRARLLLALDQFEKAGAAYAPFPPATDAEAALAQVSIAAETGPVEQTIGLAREAARTHPGHKAEILKRLTQGRRGALPLAISRLRPDT